jgi:hypothetical protein
MRELHVSTQTTPVELADFFNRLLPDDEVGGKPGAEGAIVLYVCDEAPSAYAYSSMRTAVAARVAIDVVLQHVAAMPGAQPLLLDVRAQFAGDTAPRAGWLAPPLTVLARLYRKTVNAIPAGADQSRTVYACADDAADPEAGEPAGLTGEQQQALETLLARLGALPRPSKLPGRT